MPLFSSSSSKPSPSKPTPTSQSPYPPAHTLQQSASPHAYGGQPQQTTMQYQQPYPPQASSEPPLRTWFDAVDLDRSGFITQIELKQALVNGDWQPFDDETVKMLMRLFDVDGSGTIGFNEFQGLWNYIKEWQSYVQSFLYYCPYLENRVLSSEKSKNYRVFRQFDRDRSGTIENMELSNALATFGYQLSPQLIQLLQRKYNPSTATIQKPQYQQQGFRPPQQSPQQGITFDRFVRCCVTVRQLSESFKGVDQDRDGWVQISYETFMTMVLSAP
ncbi:hypothetical protein JCM5350_000058 [Sporobolomyces pararoseus]